MSVRRRPPTSLVGQSRKTNGIQCRESSKREALKLAAALLVLAPAAAAHEWYTRECCGDMDCAPVERVEALPDGGLRVTSRVGTTVVPASFPRQESPDTQMHVCMVRYSHFDDMRPVCFFVPPTRMAPPS